VISFQSFHSNFLAEVIEHCWSYCVKTDGRMNEVVKATKNPKGPTGPDLKYQRVVSTQITSRNHMTISLEVTTGIPMAFSMHYTVPENTQADDDVPDDNHALSRSQRKDNFRPLYNIKQNSKACFNRHMRMLPTSRTSCILASSLAAHFALPLLRGICN
jgi:hypothetical protein